MKSLRQLVKKCIEVSGDARDYILDHYRPDDLNIESTKEINFNALFELRMRDSNSSLFLGRRRIEKSIEKVTYLVIKLVIFD